MGIQDVLGLFNSIILLAFQARRNLLGYSSAKIIASFNFIQSNSSLSF